MIKKRSSIVSKFTISGCLLLSIMFVASCNKSDDAKPAELTITTPANYLGDGVKGYVFLSDKDGKALASAEMKNGMSALLKTTKPYSGSTLSLTEMYVYNQEYVDAVTVMDLPVKTGTWTPFYNAVQDSQDADFQISNSADATDYSYSTNDDRVGYAESSFNISIQGKSKLFVLASTADGEKSHFFDNGGVGYEGNNSEPYPIDLSLVTSDAAVELVDVASGFDHAYVDYNGIISTGLFKGQYAYGGKSAVDGTIQVIKPSGFDSYAFDTDFSKNNNDYYNTSFTTADFSLLDATLKVKSSDKNTITYSTTGAIDFSVVGFGTTNTDDFWQVFTTKDANEKKITIPEIPSEIKSSLNNIDLANFDFNGVNLLDLKAFSSYNDFLGALQDLDILNSSLESKQVSFDKGNPNISGRMETARKRKTTFSSKLKF